MFNMLMTSIKPTGICRNGGARTIREYAEAKFFNGRLQHKRMSVYRLRAMYEQQAIRVESRC